MKTRFNFFIRTYFYFNKQERKGLVGMVLLVVFMQIASYLYGSFLPIEVPSVDTLVWSDSIQMESSTKGYILGNYQRVNYKKNDHAVLPFVFSDSNFHKKTKPFRVVEINSADSADLVSLPKIGPVLAGRIVNYRERLGGFKSLKQLTEIWGFKEDMLYDLEGKISLNPSLAKPVLLNSIALEDLRKHPYFKYTLSQALVNYRMQHGPFQKLEDVKNIKMVNDSIYHLILPYCVIDK